MSVKVSKGLQGPNYNGPKNLLSPLTLGENAQSGPASLCW